MSHTTVQPRYFPHFSVTQRRLFVVLKSPLTASRNVLCRACKWKIGICTLAALASLEATRWIVGRRPPLPPLPSAPEMRLSLARAREGNSRAIAGWGLGCRKPPWLWKLGDDVLSRRRSRGEFLACPLALRLLSTWRFCFAYSTCCVSNRRRVQLYGVNGRKMMLVWGVLSLRGEVFFSNIYFARSVSL